jgi:hypothetical protein
MTTPSSLHVTVLVDPDASMAVKDVSEEKL